MIKPEELRIGDFVKICNSSYMVANGTVCKIVGINAEWSFENKKGAVNLFHLDMGKWRLPYSVWCNDIEGIPITKKFLINNNFEETERKITEDCLEWYVYKHEASCVEVLYYPQTDDIFAFYCNKRPCKIAYVHELQNFLASVKENIKITV